MELLPFLDGYSVEAVIGEGAFGRVLLVIHRRSNQRFAVKHVPNIDEWSSKQITRELLLLSTLKHKNIISVFDIKLIDSNIFIITEHCNYDLNAVIYDDRKRNTLVGNRHEAFVTITFQILEAIKYIHSLGVIHRDIKPANILINQNLEVKICDFGIARVENDGEGNKEDHLTEYMVTRWYRAPELILNPGRYGKPQDIWAVGCTISELISCIPLFPGKDTISQLRLIVKVLGTLTPTDLNFEMPHNSRLFVERLKSSDGESIKLALEEAHSIDPNMCHILRGMLQFNPDLRFTAEKALTNPIFDHPCKNTTGSDLHVPISWGMYHDVLLNVQKANTKIMRLHIIRESITVLNEQFKNDSNSNLPLPEFETFAVADEENSGSCLCISESCMSDQYSSVSPVSAPSTSPLQREHLAGSPRTRSSVITYKRNPAFHVHAASHESSKESTSSYADSRDTDVSSIINSNENKLTTGCNVQHKCCQISKESLVPPLHLRSQDLTNMSSKGRKRCSGSSIPLNQVQMDESSEMDQMAMSAQVSSGTHLLSELDFVYFATSSSDTIAYEHTSKPKPIYSSKVNVNNHFGSRRNSRRL